MIVLCYLLHYRLQLVERKPFPDAPRRIHLNFNVYNFAGFGLYLYIQNAQLVFLGFRLRLPKKRSKARFFK
jgi:hypothetical protein